jgi:pectinesterase
LCLDVVGQSTAAGALIDQTAYAAQSNQKFGFTAMSNASGMYSFPTYSIVNRNSGKSLALPRQSTTPDLAVQQSTFTKAGYQQWMVRPVGGGVYSICNWGSSIGATMCLAVKGASTSAGAAVVQQSYTAAANQQWTISLAN